MTANGPKNSKRKLNRPGKPTSGMGRHGKDHRIDATPEQLARAILSGAGVSAEKKNQRVFRGAIVYNSPISTYAVRARTSHAGGKERATGA